MSAASNIFSSSFFTELYNTVSLTSIIPYDLDLLHNDSILLNTEGITKNTTLHLLQLWEKATYVKSQTALLKLETYKGLLLQQMGEYSRGNKESSADSTCITIILATSSLKCRLFGFSMWIVENSKILCQELVGCMTFCDIGQKRFILKVNPVTKQGTVYKGISGYGNTYIQYCKSE